MSRSILRGPVLRATLWTGTLWTGTLWTGTLWTGMLWTGMLCSAVLCSAVLCTAANARSREAQDADAVLAAKPKRDQDPEGAGMEVLGKVPFLRSVSEAMALAKSTGKPVFAYFTYHG